jgi:outer membrane protein assembly factor BamA
MLALLLFATLSHATPQAPSAAPAAVVAEILVHGNVLTTDDEVERLAGVAVGAAATPTLAVDVAARLRASHRFQQVDVRTRFASIADPSQIVLVIIVDEGRVSIESTGGADGQPAVVKSRGPHFLYFPILNAEDGYGVTYGMRMALADRVGKGSRVSFPLTWGGEKQAGAELDKRFDSGPLSRLVAGASLSRRTNPRFEDDDDRAQLSVRGERQLLPAVRAGVSGSWQHVSFGGTGDRFTQAGTDIIVDTRVDPVLPRNAVYARAGVERLNFHSAGGMVRTQIDARGYLGLASQMVLAVRAMREGADGSLPLYEKLLLGGMANLRGFGAGTAAGDTLVAGSAELLVPLTSPLHVGRIGVSAFVDEGTVYDHGARFADQTFKRGAGGSVWFSAAFVRLSVAVAHGIGGSTHVHVGGSLLF